MSFDYESQSSPGKRFTIVLKTDILTNSSCLIKGGNGMEPTQTTRKLVLKAPLSGFLVPIERVPDPVFSQKMVGDGIALDPTNESLLAPCDGRVAMLHPAGHALTLVTAEGIEVLMHIGLDTINLKGEGFKPRVANGDTVRTGTPLIDFDADFLALRARSLISMIVVTNPERVTDFERRTGAVTADRDVILELSLAADGEAAGPSTDISITSEAIRIANTSGLHARPAAVLANLARKYKSEVWVQRGEARANAKSITSLMDLDIRYEDKVNLCARGADAREAVDALVPLILSGLGEEGASAPAPASRIVPEIAKPPAVRRSNDPDRLLGVTASPGFAVGTIFQVRRQDLEVPENADDPQGELLRLEEATARARTQLEALQVQLHGQADAGKAAIFAAHQEVLDDPEIRDTVRSAILKGKSAPFAWQRTIRTQAGRMATMHNALLAARAADLRDVGQRVLQILTGMEPRRIEVPAGSILVSEEFTPSETAGLDRDKVLGFCTTLGSATSHVAIIARSLDIPGRGGRGTPGTGNPRRHGRGARRGPGGNCG